MNSRPTHATTASGSFTPAWVKFRPTLDFTVLENVLDTFSPAWVKSRPTLAFTELENVWILLHQLGRSLDQHWLLLHWRMSGYLYTSLGEVQTNSGFYSTGGCLVTLETSYTNISIDSIVFMSTFKLYA